MLYQNNYDYTKLNSMNIDQIMFSNKKLKYFDFHQQDN